MTDSDGIDRRKFNMVQSPRKKLTENVSLKILLALARPLKDVFLLSVIPWKEHGGSILLVTLLYDL